MNVEIEQSWKKILQDEFEKDYFISLTEFVKSEYRDQKVFPPGKLIFNAFEHTPLGKLKVIIVGQDPYHGYAQANGLCFSVNEDVKLPPSLVNIFKERESDLDIPFSENGSLVHWADQGVLLLNATLTVRAQSPGSHQNKGWEEFTDAVLKKVLEIKQNLVVILWGAYAQKKGAFIDKSKHFVIESAHPSPFSVHKGFFGSKPFSKCNAYLKEHGIKPIDW